MVRQMFRVMEFLRRLGRAESGLAAIEFAMTAPAMITIFLGATELSDGYIAGMKVDSVASTAADLTAQDNQICNADMNDIMAASIYPYPTATLTVKITSLIVAGNNQVKVAWSDAYQTQAHTVGSIITIPTGLVTSGGGGSIIMAETTSTYTSPIGQLFGGVYPMSSIFYLAPRTVAQITRTTTAC